MVEGLRLMLMAAGLAGTLWAMGGGRWTVQEPVLLARDEAVRVECAAGTLQATRVQGTGLALMVMCYDEGKGVTPIGLPAVGAPE